MSFKLLGKTSVSLTFELENNDIYQTKDEHIVSINGKQVLSTKRNVFTLFNLTPNTTYKVSVDSDAQSFTTKSASYILHSKDFTSSEHEKDNTLALQMAISMTPKNGLLVIDPGEYHITSLFLKSDITIEFKKGARLLATPDSKAYPLGPGEVSSNEGGLPLELLSWEGNPFPGKPSIINGYEVENVDLVGEGEINGQAIDSDFWDDVKHLPWARPRLLFLARCNNINVYGLSFKNTPCWTLHPFFSKNLGFYDLYIENPKDSPNTDGMDPEACENVNIIGVRFSVGDDCIALKSGKIYIGKTFKQPCKNVTIRNCFMNEGHGAVVLGSEAGAGLQELTIERCYFFHTDRGLRIKSRRGRGQDSIMDNVTFKNIYMDNVLTPFTINMFYFCDPDGKTDYVQDRNPRPVTEETPRLGKFTFQNITAVNAEVALGYFIGLPEMPIGEIDIIDSSFTVKKDAKPGKPAMLCGVGDMAKQGFIFENVGKVVLHNVKATGYEGELASYTHVNEVVK